MAPDLPPPWAALVDRIRRALPNRAPTNFFHPHRQLLRAVSRIVRRTPSPSAPAPRDVAGPEQRRKEIHARWQGFRRGRAFLPALIAVPVLALSSVGGAYAAWDSTRVVVPYVIGQPLVAGIEVLDRSGVGVQELEMPEPALDADCYVISDQSLSSGDRIVPEETTIRLEIGPGKSSVPDVVGMTLGEAKNTLQANCLHHQQARLWCVPGEFSGGADVLEAVTLAQDTGFTFDPFITRLRNENLTQDETWIVCDQLTASTRSVDSGSRVGLVLTAPLTTVPTPAAPVLVSALEALQVTADGCALTPELVATFPENPEALRGVRQPSAEQMAGWAVTSLAPAPGRALLCEERVRIELVWPKTTMPSLVGLFHAPATPQTATATTSSILSAGLTANCAGRGTVTSQSPAAGEPVPIGISVTCIAELIMPNIIGMDPSSAQAALVAAGVTASSSGSGVVVSQSPIAGARLTGAERPTFYAAVPQPPPPPGGGSAYYKNCDAARAAGAAPIYRGEAGYHSALDRDNDGIACE